MIKTLFKNKLNNGIPPFILVGAIAVLLPIFAYLAMENIQRQKQQNTEMLLEKSAALIRSFEAGTRTGMMGANWNRRDLQTLLTETALQPDIEYLLVTDQNGKIWAHNNPEMVGTNHGLELDLQAITESKKMGWRYLKKGESTLFEVYKNFSPSVRPVPHLPRRRMHSTSPPPEPFFIEHPIIFVGLDVGTIESAEKRDIQHTLLMTAILLVIGFIGIIIVFMAQRYQAAKSLEIEHLKREIARSQRLASIGRVAAGVAHEIRNPLSSIKGLATYFKSAFETDQEKQNLSNLMIQEIDRLNKVITQLIEIAKPVAISKSRVDIHALIKDTLLLIEKDATSKGIHIQTQLSNKIKQINADADKIKQVFFNLFLNAMDSITNDSGLLRVALYPVNQNAAIQISDNGSGIEKENLPHIFDPYFTTKKSGTGLGLAIVHNIIEAHDGHIKVDSAPGRGTKITIFLPYGKNKP